MEYPLYKPKFTVKEKEILRELELRFGRGIVAKFVLRPHIALEAAQFFGVKLTKTEHSYIFH